KKKEQHDRLKLAMERLQKEDSIYKNARISDLRITCPRNVVMVRIGIIMDMYRDTTSDLQVVKTHRRTLIQRPPSRIRVPNVNQSNGPSVFSCITCMSVNK